MAANPVANIGIDFDAKFAKLEGDLKKVSKSVDRFEKRTKKSFGGVQKQLKSLGRAAAGFAAAFAGAAGARALNETAKAAIEFGDSLAKQADRIGVSVEALQELRFAGERVGISIEKTDAGLLRFSKTIGEASDQTGTLFTLLKKSDPALLSRLLDADTLDQALDIILEKLPEIDTVMKRNALAAAAFGRQSGAAFGAAAGQIDPLQRKLRALGAIMDEKLARKAEVAADKLTDLDVVMKNKLNVAVLENIEGFTEFRELLSDVQRIAIKAAAALGSLAKFNPFSRDEADDFFDALLDVEILQGKIAAVQKNIDRSRGRANDPFGRFDSNQAIKRKARLQAQLEDAEKRLDHANAENQKRLRRERATATPIGGGDGGGDGGGNPFANIKTPGEPSKKEDAMAARAEQNFERINAIIDATRTPMEDMAARLKEIDGLLSEASDPEQFVGLLEAQNRIGEQMGELSERTSEWQRASEFAARGIADAFADAIVFGDKLGASLKRLAQQLASRVISNFLFSSIGGGEGGGGGKGLFGAVKGLFGKAGGGRIAPGAPLLVGERGPELIVPQRSATVINAADARRAAGGGGAVTVNQTLRFDVGLESVDRRIAEAAPAAASAVVAAVERLRSRPGFA